MILDGTTCLAVTSRHAALWLYVSVSRAKLCFDLSFPWQTERAVVSKQNGRESQDDSYCIRFRETN